MVDQFGGEANSSARIVGLPSLSSNKHYLNSSQLLLLAFALRVRSSIARLSDSDLSSMLSNVILKDGILLGLGQLSFLIFSSIQCENAKHEGVAYFYLECSRTLYSQTGLGYMVVLFLIIKIVSSIAPKRILDKHIVSFKKVLAVDLNFNEFVQFFGLSVAAGCALFLLGGYGAEGDFHTAAEEHATFAIGALGLVSLGATAFWKLIAIRGEMKRERDQEEEETDEEKDEEKEGEPAAPFLLEASSFWVYLGIFATTFQTCLNISGAVLLDENLSAATNFTLPPVLLCYCGSFLSQPRRNR